MSLELIPRSFWSMPSRLPSIFDEADDWTGFGAQNGLTVSEDETSVFVEAAMPGLDTKDIEVTFEKGALWIRGSKQEQETDKAKKFYRKATSSYSYRIMVPGEIDESKGTDAVYKNGVMKVTFQKQEKVQPKKIEVRAE